MYVDKLTQYNSRVKYLFFDFIVYSWKPFMGDFGIIYFVSLLLNWSTMTTLEKRIRRWTMNNQEIETRPVTLNQTKEYNFYPYPYIRTKTNRVFRRRSLGIPRPFFDSVHWETLDYFFDNVYGTLNRSRSVHLLFSL